jgi:inhibitor of KinA sporulation pathway (predicted exonuclease)
LKKVKNMKYDQILIVDIESTCWEVPQPDNLSEIIEIGITPIDTNSGDLLESRSIIVKPEHSEVSDYCTRLTTITQEDVNSGIPFKDACHILVDEYYAKKYAWGSYGYYDKKQFMAQCRRENIEYPFSNDHINIKMLFALKYSLKRNVGMTKALRMLGMPLIGIHHRGIDDSRNIANILSRILFNIDR